MHLSAEELPASLSSGDVPQSHRDAAQSALTSSIFDKAFQDEL
jgi:hypothetical protein